MPDDSSITATSDLRPTSLEERAALQKQIASASPEAVDELYRRYVIDFLASEEVPVTDIGSSEEVIDLADRIVDSLAFTHPGINRAITVQQLEALLTAQESQSTDPSGRNVSSGADPVMMFNGQFVHEVEDIRIDGAGISFVFTRTYKNQVAYDGPLGFNWDHSYNLRLREANLSVFRSTGALREDAWVRHPTFDYFVPPDGQHAILLREGNSFVLRTPGGDQYEYQQTPQTPFLHRIRRIADKFGNYLLFAYDNAGLLTAVTLNDPDPVRPHRLIRFFYDARNRIESIRDYTTEAAGGRVWRYAYDDSGDLIATTTPTTDRYPQGLTTCYEYSSAAFSAPLRHNLLRIIDPTGQIRLENEYGTAAGVLNFNRVTRQKQGAGETLLDYEDVAQVFDFAYSDRERPAHQTNVVERNGHSVHYVYNRFGNLLLREEYILERGLPRLIQWRYHYNADGALTAALSPDGTVTQYYRSRDDFVRRRGISDDQVATDPQLSPEIRLSFGNLLATVRKGHRFSLQTLNLSRGFWSDIFPDVIRVADDSDIITKFTYEPDFQQIRTRSDPRFTKSADPLATGPPLESPRYQETLTRFDYRPAQTGPDGRPGRFLSRVRYPDATLPDGTRLTDIIQSHDDYDPKGRLLRATDPEGVVTELEYFADTDGVREGYLKRKTIDPSGLAITTRYEVGEVGLTTAILQPRAEGVSDGRFRTRIEVNSLNQITRVVTSPPFSDETRSFYDPNNLLERVERDLRDQSGTPLAGGVEVRLFRHDAEFNLVRESVGSADLTTHLITRHRFDESGLRIRTIRPRRNQTRWRYDEALRITSVTRGFRSPEASTTRTSYRGEGLTDRSVNGRGNVSSYAYDAFDRLVGTADALGNVSRTDYDKAGNIVLEREFEAQPDGTYLLLSRSEYEFDEFNRQVAERANLFRTPPRATNPETEFLTSAPGELLSASTFYDKKGRAVRFVNFKGQESVRVYDALDRNTLERDAAGNFTRLFYDSDGNLVRSDTHERVIDPASGGFLREDVFSTLYDYDELNRKRLAIDGLGNATRFAWDSRDKLIEQIDPLGNITRHDYDVYGRKVADITEFTATGLGGGTPLRPAVDRSEYDENGNLVAAIDANGNRTEHSFDALDRLTVVRHPDQTAERFQYDREDNLLTYDDNNGLRRLQRFDALDRMVRMDLDDSAVQPGITVEGATFAEMRYDGLDRLVLDQNDFAENRVSVDSLGRSFEETVTLSALTGQPSVRTLRRDFDTYGHPTQLIYPSGRVIRRHLDVLNRVERIENAAKGQDYPGSTIFPDVYEVLRHEYRGLRRGRTLLANGASTAYDYDGRARLIQIAHAAPGGRLIQQHLYDAAGNMRLKNEIVPGGNPAETYKYDSSYAVTKIAGIQLPAFDPADFGPPDSPSPRSQLDGQSRIDAVIGPLAQAPADFTYRYDLRGNREEQREPPQPPLIYVPNRLNQYSLVGNRALVYDLNGNLTEDGIRRYVYDSHNRLTRVQDLPTGQDVARFFHDAQGRRVVSVSAGRATALVSDGQNVIEEYEAGTLVAQYVNEYGLDIICQMARRDPTGQSGSEHWYHKDLVRSSRMLTDQAGNVSAAYRYLPFGELVGPLPALANPYLFMGRRFDAALDAYDYRTREYVPALGRFLQRDLVVAPNPYLFLQNNPLVASDPTGRERKPEQPQDPILLPLVTCYITEASPTNYLRDAGYVEWYEHWKQQQQAERERELDREKIEMLAAYMNAAEMLTWRAFRESASQAVSFVVAGKVLGLAFRWLRPAARAATGVKAGAAAETAVAARSTQATAAVRPAVRPPAPQIVPPGTLGPGTNGLTTPNLTLQPHTGILGRLGLRRPTFNPTVRVSSNPVGSTVQGVGRHEGLHASDMLNFPQLSYMGTTSLLPGRGTAAFIMETRGYFAEFGARGLLPSYAWRSMTALERGYFIGEMTAAGAGAGYAGYRLLTDE